MAVAPGPHRLVPPQGDDRLTQLLRLQRRLAGCRDLATLLAALGEDLPALLPVRDRVSLAFIDPDGQHLRVYRVLPVVQDLPENLPRVRIDGTVAGDVARDGCARVVPDVRGEDNLRFGRASHDGIRSTASVPVVVAGRVVGVMNVGSKQIGGCHEGMLDVLSDLAAVVGPALYAVERALETSADSATPGPRLPPATAELVAHSPAMVALLGQARRAALCDATVLVTGETGVGKTLLARAMHAWSARKNGPFATVHIADLPPTLVESELFGHERGAFTGAAQRRAGRFESAHGGTLFLDEIGEAPLAVQSKLLRITQDGTFERVGGSATLRTDVRIIAATHRDLHEAVASGAFRRDLLYRLEIVALHIPPLRERTQDLQPLAQAILTRLAQVHRRPLRLSSGAWSRLFAHPWPGNVRELESVLMRAVLLEDRDELELSCLGCVPACRTNARNQTSDDWPSRDENERRYLLRVLQQTEGRIEGQHGASKILGMKPSTLRSRIKRLGLDVDTAQPSRRN
jgi:formate hydrogenlyase transcriptional activator